MPSLYPVCIMGKSSDSTYYKAIFVPLKEYILQITCKDITIFIA